MQPTATLCKSLREIEQSFVGLCAGMDLRLYQFLGLGRDSSIHLWRREFVGELLEDNLQYRLDALQALERDATRFRTTDFMSITREDFDDVAYMASRLQSQANELFSLCQGLIQRSVSPERGHLEAEVSYVLYSLFELEERESQLRHRFSEISPLLQVLALPEDRFALLTNQCREPLDANGHSGIDDFCYELDRLREERKRMQSTIFALIQGAAEKQDTDSCLLKDVNEIHDRAAQQAVMEANVARSMMTLRENVVESPSVIYAQDGSSIAVHDLLSAAQDYTQLEQKVIELHKAQLDWHLSLCESLGSLHTMVDILKMTGVLAAERS